MSDLGTIILGHLHQSRPTKLGHVFGPDDSIVDPSLLSPVFRGSFDWHSSVHSHWALLRLLFKERAPDGANEALSISFSADRVAGELAQLDRRHRRGFELPYGMAWLLTLGAELDAFPQWQVVLAPLIDLARTRFRQWLNALPVPIRSGQHSQSAFAMSLVLDAARSRQDDELADGVVEKAREFYACDRDGPIRWEPSAYDFLSPSLAEADLMRRVLGDDFAAWFDLFLPAIDLEPVVPADRNDGKFAHADGLNLSRAWMLQALAAHRPSLAPAAMAHASAGLAAIEAASYAGTHWLPTFAVYLKYGTGVDL